MKTNNISKNLDLIRKLCKSTLMCHEFNLFGLSQIDCVNRASDLASRQWGFKRENMTLSGPWHEYNFEIVKIINITSNEYTHGEIRIGKSPTNLLTVSTSIHLKNSGRSHPLTIWNDMQFLQIDDAIEHGFKGIEAYCRSSNLDTTESRSILKKISEMRDAMNPIQLSLFQI